MTYYIVMKCLPLVLMQANIYFLTDTRSEVELIVEVIDALSCWTAHVLVMMLYTQE